MKLYNNKTLDKLIFNTMTSFDALSRAEKRDLIVPEQHTDGAQITMSPTSVDVLLAALSSAPKHKLQERGYGLASSLALLAENWGVDMSAFPPDHHKRNFRPRGSWDERLLATLAILSEFTQGQGLYMGSLLCSAVELRVCSGQGPGKELVVKVADVKRVIKDLLEPLREPACYLLPYCMQNGDTD